MLLDTKGILDFIYDYSAEKSILKRFPQAVIKDASDIVHESRFGVAVPDILYRDWIIAALEDKWFRLSLLIGISLKSETIDSDFGKLILKWLEEHKKENKK